MSHDLRTPLTSIIGYLDLALEEAEDRNMTGPIPSALLVVQRNAEQLLSVPGAGTSDKHGYLIWRRNNAATGTQI